MCKFPWWRTKIQGLCSQRCWKVRMALQNHVADKNVTVFSCMIWPSPELTSTSRHIELIYYQWRVKWQLWFEITHLLERAEEPFLFLLSIIQHNLDASCPAGSFTHGDPRVDVGGIRLSSESPADWGLWNWSGQRVVALHSWSTMALCARWKERWQKELWSACEAVSKSSRGDGWELKTNDSDKVAAGTDKTRR